MKFRTLLYVFIGLIVFSPIGLPVSAQTALLIGRWSLPGKCNSEQYIYQSDGKYIWQRKERNKWKLQFQGTYTVKDREIRILGNGTMESDDFQIKYLDKKTLKVELISMNEAEPKRIFRYLKCQ